MKNIVKYLSIILIALSLIGCEIGTLPVIHIGDSTKFSEEEINEAVDCVKRNFDFESSILTDIYYDESKSDTIIKNYLNYGEDNKNKVEPENIIALLSDFDVNNSGNNPTLTAGETYVDFSFVLIRDDENGEWIIDDMGY